MTNTKRAVREAACFYLLNTGQGLSHKQNKYEYDLEMGYQLPENRKTNFKTKWTTLPPRFLNRRTMWFLQSSLEDLLQHRKGSQWKGAVVSQLLRKVILVLDPEEILFLEFLFLHYQFHCLETHKLRWIKCFSLQNTDCFSFTKIPGIKP